MRSSSCRSERCSNFQKSSRSAILPSLPRAFSGLCVPLPGPNLQANVAQTADGPQRRTRGRCGAARCLRRSSRDLNAQHTENLVKLHQPAAPVLTECVCCAPFAPFAAWPFAAWPFAAWPFAAWPYACRTRRSRRSLRGRSPARPLRSPTPDVVRSVLRTQWIRAARIGGLTASAVATATGRWLRRGGSRDPRSADRWTEVSAVPQRSGVARGAAAGSGSRNRGDAVSSGCRPVPRVAARRRVLQARPTLSRVFAQLWL